MYHTFNCPHVSIQKSAPSSNRLPQLNRPQNSSPKNCFQSDLSKSQLTLDIHPFYANGSSRNSLALQHGWKVVLNSPALSQLCHLSVTSSVLAIVIPKISSSTRRLAPPYMWTLIVSLKRYFPDDCWLQGQSFEKPERVPFRLTQNLVDAMGVTGYDGVFRKAGEVTMKLLRANSDTLMSVLESFIHDPLVEWNRRKVEALALADNRKQTNQLRMARMKKEEEHF